LVDVEFDADEFCFTLITSPSFTDHGVFT